MCLKALGEWEEEWGEGIVRSLGYTCIHTIFKITNKNLLYSTWNSAQYTIKTSTEKEFEKEYIPVHV